MEGQSRQNDLPLYFLTQNLAYGMEYSRRNQLAHLEDCTNR